MLIRPRNTGRSKETIAYKEEVLKRFSSAKWEYSPLVEFGAIYDGNVSLSDTFQVAWKAWESAYYKNYNAIMQLKKK